MKDYYAGIRRRNKKHSTLNRILRNFLVIVIIIATIAVYYLYHSFYASNVWLDGKSPTYIYIPTNANFENVKSILYQKGLIVNRNSFEWIAQLKNYQSNIRAGRYKIETGMSNSSLINKL